MSYVSAQNNIIYQFKELSDKHHSDCARENEKLTNGGALRICQEQ